MSSTRPRNCAYCLTPGADPGARVYGYPAHLDCAEIIVNRSPEHAAATRRIVAEERANQRARIRG